MDAAALYAFIIANGYFFLFLLLVIEGPVVTYIGGLAASLGYLSFGWLITLAILGSIILDSCFFLLGRYQTKRVRAWAHRKENRKGALEDINKQIVKRPVRTLAYIKLMPYLSVLGFVLAGMSDIKFWRFIMHGTWIGAFYITTFGILGWLSAIPLQALDTAFGWAQLILFLLGAGGIAYWFYYRRYSLE
jgi:membrane protein DedA with SNARE-associated domain